ncbi:hypothetical protein [Elioraea sp. Yellowstone]|jgi:hypothetical protein|nr:hypothetical protein [Elioraea sp. Yellowstone]
MTKACLPEPIIVLVSAKCGFIAAVLQAGRIGAAPVPPSGQTAPKTSAEA